MYAYTNILFTPPRPCWTQSASDQSPATSDLSFVAAPLRRMDYFRPAANLYASGVFIRKPTKSAVDAGRAFADVYIEKRPAEVHPTGRNKSVLPVHRSLLSSVTVTATAKDGWRRRNPV